MNTHAVQTTIPADVAEVIEKIAREQMIPKSAVVRQLLVRRIREIMQLNKVQEVPA